MTFTTPLGLLALLAVPAVLALHLFRNRLRERRVAASFLWPAQALHAGGGRTRTRLLRSASLWCELAAALALAAWLGGLSFGGVAARPLGVVVDDTASMAAAGTRERALAAIDARLAARGGGAVSVLRTGKQPEALLDARERAGDVAAALQRWQPAQPHHAPDLALDLARELAGPGGDTWFVTDGPHAAAHPDVEVLAFGVPVANAAIRTADRLPRGDGDEELRVRVAAHGGLASARARVFADGVELTAAPVPFVDGVASLVVALPRGADVVRVQLAGDALAIDDEAWVLPAVPRVVAVADELPAERRAELGLDRVFAALTDWRAVAAGEAPQLLLRGSPGAVGNGQLELVLASGSGAGTVHREPFLVDRAHPWVRGLGLHGVTWVAGEPALPGQVLIAAGAHVLASEEPLPAGRRAWLCVRGANGNVVRAPDWPVLFANLLDACRPAVPGIERAHVLVGGEARLRLAAVRDAEPPTCIDPAGGRRRAAGGATAGWVAERPGLHRVVDVAGRDVARFAARFLDPVESDLLAMSTFVRAASRGAAEERAAPMRDTGIEARVLAWLLALAVLLDWWVLARRST
jgi:hypothetical protein